MSDVKRLNFTVSQFESVVPYASEHGQYVRFADYAKLEAEAQALRDQVKALQSDANSYQSGYDEGRRMGTKHRQSEVEQLTREVAALRARVVIVPERKALPELMMATWHETKGWNACLDELARLNGKAVSMADISACLDAELREWTGDHRKAVERALTDANGRIRYLLSEGKEGDGHG